MEQRPLFRSPDDFLVQHLPASFPKRRDDSSPMIEVVPELLRIDQVHLGFVVSKEIASTCVMKKQPSVLIDDVQACRAVFQNLAKLPLLLGKFRLSLPERGHIIDPRYSLPSHEADVPSLIRAGEDRVRRAISTCESAVERSEKLIQHLLAFARRQPLVYELFDLNERLPAMRDTLQQVGSNLRIQLELGKDLWPVEGDSTQLELVLINLVANARDAMPDGGVVEVGASNRTLRPTEGEVEGDFVELWVRDYGVGILPETLGRVWEPFFTTKGAGKGTGLGLASVYGFAKQSGGFAKIESQVGAGTTVSIFMPKGAGMRVLGIDTGLKTTEPVVSFAKIN